MNNLVPALAALALLVAFLFLPLPAQHAVSYLENVSYNAVVVREEGTTDSSRQCTAYVTPNSGRSCSSTNVSYAVTNVECSNISTSFEKYTVRNLEDRDGRFQIAMGFWIPGGTSARTYDQVIGGHSSGTFTFSIDRADTGGCFFNVESAVTDSQCQDTTGVTSETVCMGGVASPSLVQMNEMRYKEVELQRVETNYESIISKFFMPK